MNYFNIKRPIFIVPSDNCVEEFEKIDKFIELLNKSGIGKIIDKKKKSMGRNGYNTFGLVATIIYCFSKFKGTIREIEKVSGEFMLMCLGANMRKYFLTLDGKKLKNNYWNTPSNLKEEKFPFPKQKKN